MSIHNKFRGETKNTKYYREETLNELSNKIIEFHKYRKYITQWDTNVQEKEEYRLD